MQLSRIFKPRSGAPSFFLSILIWGIGVGCFSATLNNFLAENYQMSSIDRGWLEFFREMPGLFLIVLFAWLHSISDWKIMRLGTLFSLAGALLLFIPAGKIGCTAFIVLWSLGEHLVMPVRQNLAMQVAFPEHAGQSLGILTSVQNFGAVAGSLIIALIFYLGSLCPRQPSALALFNTVWGVIAMLLAVSVCMTFTRNAPDFRASRPKIYFHRKFAKYYALELFYGARKQVFFTFGPYVLIRNYHFCTADMAALMGLCAILNIFAAPAVGKITDRIGYRNVMIWDTVILCVVCLLYGYAGDIFPQKIALAVVCVNYVVDAILSTTSLATNIYIRGIASSSSELASTMSTGISINHLISILIAPLGGWIWAKYGIGPLFIVSAVMALCNSAFAYTLPRPRV